MALFTPHQTNTTAGCGNLTLTSRPLAIFAQPRRLKRVLPLGSTGTLIIISASLTNRAATLFQTENQGSAGAGGIAEPGIAYWPAGNYIIPLNITTANTNLTWTETYVHRISHGCSSVALLGSLVGQSISLGTVGIKTMIVAGIAYSNNENDMIYITLVFSNASAMAQTAVYMPNQVIITPIILPTNLKSCGVGT